MASECQNIFPGEKNPNPYYSENHRRERTNISVIAFQKLFQTGKFHGGQERRLPEQEPVEEASRQRSGEEIVPARRSDERRPRMSANPLQSTANRQILQSECVAPYIEEKKREFRRKHEENSDKISFRVNVPQMTRAKTRKVKVGLVDLFKTEINPIISELKPRIDNWENWQIFEKTYEEALHLLRVHAVKSLKRNENKIYRFTKVNP
jgi:hypothetical protein